jgi:uncharacterized protein YbbC (DUF1343 family)
MRAIVKLSVRPVLVIIMAVALAGVVNGQAVETGIEQLVKSDFGILKGKRVGLVTNPTGVDHNLRSTVDILFNAPGVKLVALYGPEHGVRGEFTAGALVQGETDPSTGLPVYSLYGKTRKPTPEMLKGIDVLVYDIQDIGSRSYTFISTLGLLMLAAAENNIPVVVLDRPNPLGGIRMEGAVTRPGFISFVSQFEIPYIHGLTVGELAMFLNGEQMLQGILKCQLEVIKMQGWTRDMYFNETGLPWVPSSPQVPSGETPMYYAATGIAGELHTINEGVGYTLPFQLFATDWINADLLAGNLNNLELPGIIFRPIHYTPRYGTYKDQLVHGVQVHLTDPENAPLTLIQFYIMQEIHRLWPEKDLFADASRLQMFDKVCGTDSVRLLFKKSYLVNDISEIWSRDIPAYRLKASGYFLYE